MEKIKEKILCAAIWYKDLPTVMHQPVNIDRGLVISGHRHGSIIQTVYAFGLKTVQNGGNAVGDFVQGFLTSENRFIDRKEAHKLFTAQGGRPMLKDKLYSEDLY